MGLIECLCIAVNLVVLRQATFDQPSRRTRPPMAATGEPNIAGFCIAVVASGADFLAAFPEIDREVGPLDFGLIHHAAIRSTLPRWAWKVRATTIGLSAQGARFEFRPSQSLRKSSIGPLNGITLIPFMR